MNDPSARDNNRPGKPRDRTWRSILFTSMLAIAGAWQTPAQVVHTLGKDPLQTGVSLATGSQTLTLTDQEGQTQEVRLEDISLIEFDVKPKAVRDGELLLINNDRGQWGQVRTAKVKLRKGLHRFVIPYWQNNGEHRLSVKVSGPGINGQSDLAGALVRCFRSSTDKHEPSPGIDEAGYRLPELPLELAKDASRMRERAMYKLYQGNEQSNFNNVTVLSRLELKRTGSTETIDTGLIDAGAIGGTTRHVGLLFEGFVVAQQDGEFTFSLSSDDGAQLYLGEAHSLLNGDRDTPINSPWSAYLEHDGLIRGELKAIKDDKALIHIPLVSDSTIALGQVQMLIDSSITPDTLTRNNEPADLDTAYIRDKKDPDQITSVSGKVLSLDDQSLSFSYRGKARTIDRGRVAGLVFKHADRPAPPEPGTFAELRLRGGQVIPATLQSLDDKHIAFEILGGSVVTPPRNVLKEIRIVNGRVFDLTRTSPAFEETIPYFGLKMPSRLNESFSGEPIRLFNDRTYARGIAVHSKSRLHYKLDQPAERFTATFGLLNPGGRLGQITARVLGDGKILWQQENIEAQTGAIELDVALNGTTNLILEVDFGQGQGVRDRAAWCNPHVIYGAAENE